MVGKNKYPIEMIEKYKDWDWSRLSSHDKLTMEIVEKYIDKPWILKMSGNSWLSMGLVVKYPDKPWDWHALSLDDTLTMEIIEKCPDKPWDWEAISNHDFELDYKNILKKIKFDIIDEELMATTWHPSRFQDWCIDEEDKAFHD